MFVLGMVVFVVLLVLKLTALATITWLWVFSPLAIGLVLQVVFTMLALVAYRAAKKNFFR